MIGLVLFTFRSDIFMNPWNLRLNIVAEWHTFVAIPTTVVSINTDPISVFLGPQNVLAFLQVYHTFGDYIQVRLKYEMNLLNEE